MHVAASSDHPRLPAFVHYAPATMVGAPPVGPPPGPAGPNQTSPGSNRGRTRENGSREGSATSRLHDAPPSPLHMNLALTIHLATLL
ncbi:hypothetical protein F511_44745 [Dorcoceras hygrometricum]|uniref:Uncharacterized protein n=1 Tax=Dorcoceras hygrometricum TaxID=472368 RepID=A0A2Z7A571_9LAMI|nr:hypothetical protein F511_44745 [Dorcoceras hygrometricum]